MIYEIPLLWLVEAKRLSGTIGQFVIWRKKYRKIDKTNIL